MAVLLRVVVLAAAACGGDGSGPTGPTLPVSEPAAAHLTFHVYDSVRGRVPGADFTRTVQASGSDAFPSVSITLTGLSVEGVDPLRAALRLGHQEDQIGPFVSRTTNGVLTVTPSGDATFDLFLMSAASGVDYDCLDYPRESVIGASTNFPRLRRATEGTVLGLSVVDGPDEPFRTGVEEFNRALNPFGMRYGYIDYVGAMLPDAEMTAGWVKISDGGENRGGFGFMAVVIDGANQQFWAPIYVVHELGHAYLGAPDFYQNTSCFEGSLSCALMDCAAISPALTPTGADAVRYWSLTERRRGR